MSPARTTKKRPGSAKTPVAEDVAEEDIEPPRKSRAPSRAPINPPGEDDNSAEKTDTPLESSDRADDHFDEQLVTEQIVVEKPTEEEEKIETYHPELQNPTISSILNASDDDTAKVFVYLLPHEITLFERPDILADRIRATLVSMDNIIESGFLDNHPNKTWLSSAQTKLKETLDRYEAGEPIEPEAYKGTELGEFIEDVDFPPYDEFAPEKNPTTERPVLVDRGFEVNKAVLLNYFGIKKDEDLPRRIVTDGFVTNLPLHVDFITSGRGTKNFPKEEREAFDKRVNDYATYLREETGDKLEKFAAAFSIYREFNEAFEKKFHNGLEPNEDKNTIHPLRITWPLDQKGGKFNNTVAEVMDEIDDLATRYRVFMKSEDEVTASKRRFLKLHGDTLFAVPYLDDNGNITLNKEGKYDYETGTEDLPYETGSYTVEVLNEIANAINLYTQGKVTFDGVDHGDGYISREQIGNLWTKVFGEGSDDDSEPSAVPDPTKDNEDFNPKKEETTETSTTNPSSTQTSEESYNLLLKVRNTLKNRTKDQGKLLRALKRAGFELPTKYDVSETTGTETTHEDLPRAGTPPPQTSELSTRDDIFTDQMTARARPDQSTQEIVRAFTPAPMTSELSSRDDIFTDQLTTRAPYERAVQEMGNALIAGSPDETAHIIQRAFSLVPREPSASGFGGSEVSLAPEALLSNEYLQRMFQEAGDVLKRYNMTLPEDLMARFNVTKDLIRSSWNTVHSLTAEMKLTQDKNVDLGNQVDKLMEHNNHLQNRLQELLSQKGEISPESNKVLEDTLRELRNMNNSYNTLRDTYEKTKLQLETAQTNAKTMESRLHATNRDLERSNKKVFELMKKIRGNDIQKFVLNLKSQKDDIAQRVSYLKTELVRRSEQLKPQYNELNQMIQRLRSVSQQPGPAADNETINVMKADLKAKDKKIWELMAMVEELEKQSYGAAEILAGFGRNYQEHMQNRSDKEVQAEDDNEGVGDDFYEAIIQNLEFEKGALESTNEQKSQRILELNELLAQQISDADENLRRVSKELTDKYQEEIEELKEKLHNRDARLLNKLANMEKINREKEGHKRTMSEISLDEYAKRNEEWIKREKFKQQLSNERYAFQKGVDDKSADRREKRKADARAKAAKDKLTSRMIMNNRFADLLMKLTGTGNPELMAYATGMFYDFLKSAANLSDEELAARDIDKIINMYDNGAIGRMVAAIGSQKQSSVEDSLSKRISDLENTTRNFISLVSQRTAHVGAAAAYHPPRRVFVGRNGVAYQGNRRARTSKSPRRAPSRKANGQFKRKAKK